MTPKQPEKIPNPKGRIMRIFIQHNGKRHVDVVYA